MPSILDGILPPQQEDQDSITRRLYPWLAPPPTASGPMPTPALQPTPPMARPVDVPHGTPAPIGAPPSPVAPQPTTPRPVSLGPGTAAPQPASPPSQPVTLGSSLDRPAPMPQPPPQAKPGLGAKLTAVALGASGGMPGIEKAIDYYQGVKNKPIADWDKQNAREATSNKAALETRNTESEIDLRSAEADKDRTPPVQRPENPNQVYADAVQEAVNAGRDPRTDPKVLQIADTITSIQPERAPKAAEKILGHTVEELKGEMAANPALYPGGYMEGAAGFKNTKAAAMALDKAKADADRAPEKSPRQLIAVPQPDGSSKVIEATAGTSVPKGAQTIPEMGHKNAPTADEERRADLSRNMNENLDQLEQIVKNRPDLFGPAAGRLTSTRGAIGTGDPDIAQLSTIKEQIGMAMVGAHAMRNAQHVEAAATSILNSFKNEPAAVLQSIQAARNSVKTFIDDVQNKGGTPQPAPAAGAETKSYNGFEYTKGSDGQWHKGKPLQ